MVVWLNRRGGLVWTLLFFVSLFLVTASLYGMASFKGGFDTKSGEISEMINELDFSQIYVEKSAEKIGGEMITVCNGKCEGNELKKISDKYDPREKGIVIEGFGNFFGKIGNGEFSLEKEGKGYGLNVTELFVSSERGASKLKRNFELRVCFDGNGVVENCSV